MVPSEPTTRAAQPTWWQVPVFLLSSSLRVFLLRAMIITGSICLASDTGLEYTPGIVVNSLTIAHYFFCALGPLLFPLYFCIDILLTIAETGYYVHELIPLNQQPENLQWSPRVWVVGVFSYWGATLTITALLFVKLLHLVDSRGRTLLKRVNIAGERLDSPIVPAQDPANTKYAGITRITGPPPNVWNSWIASAFRKGWWKYPLHTLTGRKVWERRLPGEALWLIGIRGILSFFAIASIVGYAAFAIFLQPLSELGLTPNLQLRAQIMPDACRTLNKPIVWNLVLVQTRHANKSLSDMVTVEPLWAPNRTTGLPLPGPPCNLVAPIGGASRHLDVVVFNCPPRSAVTADDPRHYILPLSRPEDNWPILSLTADFSKLADGSGQPGVRDRVAYDAIKVYLGLTNDVQDVLSVTRPTVVFPGTNMVALADLRVRRRLIPATLATSGLFNVYDTFFFTEVLSTGVDAFPMVSPDPNISTLRIGWQGHEPDEWVMAQDYQTKSIINGISALGGLGSALSTAFAIFFGASLMRVVYRTKPETPFGLLHRLEKQKRDVAKRCSEKYPKLASDIEALKTDPGLVAFLLDTLIDVDILKDNIAAASAQNRLAHQAVYLDHLRTLELGRGGMAREGDSESEKDSLLKEDV